MTFSSNIACSGKVLRDETDSSHKVSRNRNSGFTSVEDEIILESRENNASWKVCHDISYTPL